MAAGADMTAHDTDVIQSPPNTNNNNTSTTTDTDKIAISNAGKDPDFKMQDIVHMLSNLKLNPLAKEFFPSSYSHDRNRDQDFDLKNPGTDDFPNNRKGKKRPNGRGFKAQREDSIRRTVYVSDIDHNVTEEHLAGLFSGYGQVVDCRVCGDSHSRLRFAFVEFADEHSARAALGLCGTMIGFSPLKVLPSKTAILPVNPTFLPRSEDEREMCTRTVYCTNIDKKVSQGDVKTFFESRCGEVSRLRLLGDQVHSTRIAFVEFVGSDSALVALDCCGQLLGSQPIRVSPSKTPVRPRVPRLLQ